MGPKVSKVEVELARIAASQHGVVTRRQVLEAGISAKEIRIRVRRKSLLRVHRGVYRVGHTAPSIEATYLAAVLAAGDGAALGRRAAAHVWDLARGPAPPPQVLVPNERRIEGVKTHRSLHLDARDLTLRHGIPVTKVARTLVDVAAELAEDDLARMCHEAGVRYQVTPREVSSVLAKRPNARGAGKLRRIIEGDVRVTLSELESRFLQLLRNEGLPLPVTNRPAGSRRVDCRWPDHLLTVELDGYRFHNSRHAWEQDRRREREARARGDDFRRYTYGDVEEHPALMIRELHTFFAA
jgi:very-short-patch-repair endonuclease